MLYCDGYADSSRRGNRLAVYMRFRRWQERGVWQRLWAHMKSEQFATARELMMDSITIRAHQHAAGVPKKTPQIRLLDALSFDKRCVP